MKLFIGWRLFLLSILLFVPFFSWAITRIVRSQHFDNYCGFYLQESFSDNSNPPHGNPEFIAKNLDNVIEYLENNKLTSGFTSVFDRSSDDDLSLFYDSIKKRAAYTHALTSVSAENMKVLKEYADMQNLHPTWLHVPDGISIYPHNILFFIWMIVSLLLAGLGIIGIVTFIDERARVK